MPRLVLGPLLRHVGERDATVWVETDRPCEVEVLGHRARTFCVSGHHYALVLIDGLRPGERHAYTVTLDGERHWPPPESGFPPSMLRTLEPERGVRVAFGSCRSAIPHEPPHTYERSEHPEGRGVDALRALARRMAVTSADGWPDLLLMLGDQVYADELSPETAAFVHERRRQPDAQPPPSEVADFEEYTRLYLEAWSEPTIRWLLSTVPSAMIFDDHDVHDDWNTSASWKEDIRRKPWWDRRITGAFASYWLYQHLGNLAPDELRRDALYEQVRAADDGGPLLERFALQADRTTDGSRWSYSRRLGRSHLVVIDSRAGRLFAHGRREMVDDEEWRWLEGELRGGVDHLLVATSLPYLLPLALHRLEAFDEALAASRNTRAAALGEDLRRRFDLEHWAAFRSSFERLAGILRAVGSGELGDPPASIVLLSGDVHYSYLAEAWFPGRRLASRLYQATCSPLRNCLHPPLELAARVSFTRPPALLGRLLTRLLGVPEPPLRWTMRHGPFFENEVATLDLRGREAHLLFEHTPPRRLELSRAAEARLA